jgi:hypothetical protein
MLRRLVVSIATAYEVVLGYALADTIAAKDVVGAASLSMGLTVCTGVLLIFLFKKEKSC